MHKSLLNPFFPFLKTFFQNQIPRKRNGIPFLPFFRTFAKVLT